MIIIFLLIPLSIATAAVFLGAFIWAVRSGQYEDTCTPSLRLLAEDSEISKNEGPGLVAALPGDAPGKLSGATPEQIKGRE
jgi:cbb3-type cytochrome oxidase maturation protein